MFKRIGLAVLGAIVLAAPASAQGVVQPIHVINQAGVPAKRLHRIESGLLKQINHQVRPWWHTPELQFASAGWPVYIAKRLDGGIGGQHDIDANAIPYARVSAAGGADGLSQALSHELIEMLINPHGDRLINGYLAEACDPVMNATYFVWTGRHQNTGTFVQDFVTPRWFFAHSQGRWDQTAATTHAEDLRFGYTYKLDPQTDLFDFVGVGVG